jgi:hypothetical protein
VAVVLSNEMFEMRSAKRTLGPFPVPNVQSNAWVDVVYHYGKRAILQYQVPGSYELRAYTITKKGLRQIGDPAEGTDFLGTQTSAGHLLVTEKDGGQFRTAVYNSALKQKGEVTLGAYPTVKDKTIGEVLGSEGKVRVHQWK